MLRAERSRKLDLYRLGTRQGGVQARALASQRFVPLVGLVRQENSLGLAVRSEGYRLGRGTLTAEARENTGEPPPDFRQWVHLDHRGISHN